MITEDFIPLINENWGDAAVKSDRSKCCKSCHVTVYVYTSLRFNVISNKWFVNR